MPRIIIAFIFCLTGSHVLGQDLASEFGKFAPFMQSLNYFSRHVPQEKIYLHFDNTSYYQGDNIWFKCYVVTSGQHQLSHLSKTLYVELLNPGGEIVGKRILKIDNGQCHGEFTLNQLPFYSGFYEIRAYTKYMLNFGDDVIFSRLLPVFNKPATEGDFEEKKMTGYGRYGPSGSFPMKREPPLTGNRVNLRFFPEGGNLIQGVASRIAFEATDEAGNPLSIDSCQLTIGGKEISITARHEGKGVFTCTPDGGRRNDAVEFDYSGRKYRFDLPACLPQGIVMEVNSLSHPDSIGITLRKSVNTPAGMFGIAMLSGSILQNYCFAWLEEDEVSFQMDKTRLPAGVSRIVLFDSRGDIVCDRLIFSGTRERLDIRAKAGKTAYRPYELVDIEMTVTDAEAKPACVTFSLSVRDGSNEVEGNHTILTDLLLMSEIRGHVRNPSYYFEDCDDAMRHAALDLLLMVQGWRRYSWKQMAGAEPFALKYLPEQGIETRGTVLNLPLIGRQKPQPDVDVDLLLTKKEEDGNSAVFAETFVTDSQGRFTFVSDVSGKWNMALAVREKGKPKNYPVVLDRVFSPEPRRYNFAELQINIAQNHTEYLKDDGEMPESMEDDFDDPFFAAYQDSLAGLGIDEKIHQLPEVIVTAGRRMREQKIYRVRSTSVACYDAASEYDNMYDSGGFESDDIHEFMMKLNEDFYFIPNLNDALLYKNKLVLFVINYEPTTWVYSDFFKYRDIKPSAIKSIYIVEDVFEIHHYIISLYKSWKLTALDLALKYVGCAVFIETYPEGENPFESAKGVRKTWLEGYSPVKEFYSPDYSALPPEPDYRRTLYWNPMVTPDETGRAKINFYNNSSCTDFSISAETVTHGGIIGILSAGKF